MRRGGAPGAGGGRWTGGGAATVALGVVLGLMNPCFYLAIAHLPLAHRGRHRVLARRSRSRPSGRVRLATQLRSSLAVAGVYLLTDVRLGGTRVGFVFAFLNAALFALYIVLAHRVAPLPGVSGIDGLALAMLFAALVVTPIGGWQGASALVSPVVLIAGIGVAITSSVIPYVCDQLAMAKLTRSTYSLFVALLPATAAVIGIVVLAQVPSPPEVVAMALIVGGVALHREAARA